MLKNTKSFSLVLALLALSATAAFPFTARADKGDESDDSAIVLPVNITDSTSASGAEVEANTVKAAEVHAAWLKELADHPDNKLNAKADRREPFRTDRTKMRCWVSGFSITIGAQSGVCKSAGRKFNFSALALGVGAELHTGRLKFVSATEIPDAGFSLSGGRESLSILLGFEEYQLSNSKGASMSGHGVGLGIGGAVELIWVTITPANATLPAPILK
jgi:hypothetical protein